MVHPYRYFRSELTVRDGWGEERGGKREIAGTLNIIFFGAQRFPVVWLARGWTGEVARWEGGSRRGRIHTDPGSSPFRAGALW